ncbi:alpha/beta-hydrolase [Clavulina sp. PMI_390]|nr:alpha/beta-hydrolase [Clavulina sp. PMI_390]
MEAASRHTVEELQEFANTRIPAPPSVRSIRLLVPISCCNEAADYLIQALGGPEQAKSFAGGVKWWQVRGLQGIDANWLASKKDIEARRKAQQQARRQTSGDSAHLGSAEPEPKRGSGEANSEEDASYTSEMDTMPCMYYMHGGGYYFGSVDQERYTMQRYARKMKGRVFSINYRLAPQYPWPVNLYLIQPPAGAHAPIPPSKIVFAGASAGGGLILSLLQAVRDVGLPLPAGAVLVSPWTDLTHSFPSIFKNTPTDIIPTYGLSLYKPSTLWPPPHDDLISPSRERFSSRLRSMLVPHRSRTPTVDHNQVPNPALLHVRAGILTRTQRALTTHRRNHQMDHPLISPALGYLGGLPPLLIIASDKEVLRDEIVFVAHKAANPSKYPVKEEARNLQPHLRGIEEKYGPTNVHLQIYDAIAGFCRHVTSDQASNGSSTPQSPSSPVRPAPTPSPGLHPSSAEDARHNLRRSTSASSIVSDIDDRPSDEPWSRNIPDTVQPRPQSSLPEFDSKSPLGTAGHSFVYRPREATFVNHMIRERVGTDGLLRPLESEDSLPGCTLPIEKLGVISETGAKRYLDGQALWNHKYASAAKKVVHDREKNVKQSLKYAGKVLDRLQTQLDTSAISRHRLGSPKGGGATIQDIPVPPGDKQDLRVMLNSPLWTWSWALEDEQPPPSSIAARGDTGEARKLSRSADIRLDEEESRLSANNLWAVALNALTGRSHKKRDANA